MMRLCVATCTRLLMESDVCLHQRHRRGVFAAGS